MGVEPPLADRPARVADDVHHERHVVDREQGRRRGLADPAEVAQVPPAVGPARFNSVIISRYSVIYDLI